MKKINFFIIFSLLLFITFGISAGTLKVDKTADAVQFLSIGTYDFVDLLDKSTPASDLLFVGDRGLTFNSDGDKAITITSGGTLQEYTCSGSFDLDTCSEVDTYNISNTQEIYDLSKTDNETVIAGVDYDNNIIWQVEFNTAFDISAGVTESTKDISSDITNALGFSFDSDGDRACISNSSQIQCWDLDTTYDATSINLSSKNGSFTWPQEAYGFEIHDGGKELVTGDRTDTAREYEFGTAGDFSTLSEVDSFSLSSNPTRGAIWVNGGSAVVVHSGDGHHKYE